jgi:beta-alanine degradation protein BauB
MAKDKGTLAVADLQVVVTGAATGYHTHEYDYVIVPVTTGPLGITGPQGETRAELVAGKSYFRPRGVEHDVKNINDFPFAFVEIEMKG